MKLLGLLLTILFILFPEKSLKTPDFAFSFIGTPIDLFGEFLKTLIYLRLILILLGLCSVMGRQVFKINL